MIHPCRHSSTLGTRTPSSCLHPIIAPMPLRPTTSLSSVAVDLVMWLLLCGPLSCHCACACVRPCPHPHCSRCPTPSSPHEQGLMAVGLVGGSLSPPLLVVVPSLFVPPHCLPLAPSFMSHCSPIPPHEQLLAAVVQGAVVVACCAPSVLLALAFPPPRAVARSSRGRCWVGSSFLLAIVPCRPIVAEPGVIVLLAGQRAGAGVVVLCLVVPLLSLSSTLSPSTDHMMNVEHHASTSTPPSTTPSLSILPLLPSPHHCTATHSHFG